jgi:hypothetical protein
MQVRRLKASGGTIRASGAHVGPEQLRESRVNQEYNYLRSSQLGGSEVSKLREENGRLSEENRRLAILLKDGNKLDVTVLNKESQALRRDN